MASENRREYLRIADQVEVQYRLVGPEEAAEIAQERRERPSIHNLALIKALEEASRRIEEEAGLPLLLLHKVLEIDQKLASIARALESPKRDSEARRLSHTVDLSAGGLSLPLDSRLKKGTSLDLTLLLPTFPALTIRALGTVAREAMEGAASARDAVGVLFEAIHEEDREMLYHYIFQRQREQIRQAAAGQKVAAGRNKEPTGR